MKDNDDDVYLVNLSLTYFSSMFYVLIKSYYNITNDRKVMVAFAMILDYFASKVERIVIGTNVNHEKNV